jgi:hypothetical protein
VLSLSERDLRDADVTRVILGAAFEVLLTFIREIRAIRGDKMPPLHPTTWKTWAEVERDIAEDYPREFCMRTFLHSIKLKPHLRYLRFREAVYVFREPPSSMFRPRA